MDADELEELNESSKAQGKGATNASEAASEGEELPGEGGEDEDKDGDGGGGGEVVKLGDEAEGGEGPEGEDKAEKAAALEGGEPEAEQKPVKYFLARCSNKDALQKSIHTGTWQIQARLLSLPTHPSSSSAPFCLSAPPRLPKGRCRPCPRAVGLISIGQPPSRTFEGSLLLLEPRAS